MSDSDFNNYTDNIIPSRLFQQKKGRVHYEKQLVKILAETPELLNKRPLQWFVNYYLSECTDVIEDYKNDRKLPIKVKRFEDLYK